MKIVIDDGQKNPDGKVTHEVHINNETYEVENLKKIENCSYSSCKYYNSCVNYKMGVVRKFDCEKNQKRIIRIYNFITTFIIAELFICLFYIKRVSFFKGVGILLIGIVLLDIICSIIETAAPRVRDIYFYKKIKKEGKKKKLEIEKKEEVYENEDIQDEMARFYESPYYQDVLKTETILNRIKELSESYDEITSDSNNVKIKKCINKANDILLIFKKDILGNRMGIIRFKNTLEEFLYIFKLYVKFLNENEDSSDDSKKKIFIECVNRFLYYLSQQQINSLIDNSSFDAQFTTSAEIFKKMLDNKGGY